MHRFKKYLFVIGLLAVSTSTVADTITETFNNGDTLTAGKMNSIKSAVNGNDAGITANTASIGANSADIATNASSIATNASAIAANAAEVAILKMPPNFSGYGMPFSADGAPKNVIVRKTVNDDGSGFYTIRSRYANSTEQIEVQGVLTMRPFIANYVFAPFDSNGDLTSLSNYIEAPNTAAYIDFVVEESTYDLVSAAKSVFDSARRDVWNCDGGGAFDACEIPVFINGVESGLDQSHSVYRLLGQISIGSMTFPDVLGIDRVYNSSRSYRIRAKGIGEIFRMQDGGRVQKVIYYRAGGMSGGSLAGTPFDSGQLFDGIFF